VQAQAKLGVPCIKFVTKPHEKHGDYNFSYSGLKTAVINYLHNAEQRGQAVSVPDVCASFQAEAVEQVVRKTIDACKNLGYKKIVLAGGVSANLALREAMTEEAQKIGAEVFYPKINLCTDNAAMIASMGYFDYIENRGIVDDIFSLEPKSSISLATEE
jgi:N6-L-threonylcarbamoyladenine synthase